MSDYDRDAIYVLIFIIIIVIGVNLTCADLYNTKLNSVDLNSAVLDGAFLYGADLSKAKLAHIKCGNISVIKSMQFETWQVVMTKDVICVGCEQHTVDEWKNYTDDEISEMSPLALDFYNKWKNVIFDIHEKGFEDE